MSKIKPLKSTPAERAFLSVLDSKTVFKKEVKFSRIKHEAERDRMASREAIEKASRKWQSFVARYFKAKLKDPKYWIHIDDSQIVKNYSNLTVKPHVNIIISWAGCSVTIHYMPAGVADFKRWADEQIAWIGAHK